MNRETDKQVDRQIDGQRDRQVQMDSLINGGDIAPGVPSQHVSMTSVNEAVLERPADVDT